MSLLKQAKIITKYSFFWSFRIRFFRKFNEKLRMIHAFCILNDAIIKINYSMKKLKFIFKNIAQRFVKYFFRTNATNKFWIVSMYFSHAYKFEFNTTINHYCYFRMNQEIIENSKTYTQLKKTVTNVISFSNSESTLSETNSDHTIFNHFVNDDVEKFDIFENLINFFYQHYFSKLSWAKLTLNFSKCEFFISKVELLKHQKNDKNIKFSKDKLKIFKKYFFFKFRNSSLTWSY